ncbi:MAG: hypothetical protein NW206_16175 [Hyphomonadaceae bacterium]|nr:hypothetical protein [Hyphomonadaceae bacterium]
MAEPLNATFFAFRKREKSGVLTQAAIGFAIGMILITVAFFAAFASALMPLVQWYGEMMTAAVNNDTSAMETMGFPPSLGLFVLGSIVWMFALFILMAAFEAACLRWLVRGESGGGLLGLNFGADTWRVYSGYWIWFLLYMAFSMVFGIVVGVVIGGAAIGMMAGANGADASSAGLGALALMPIIYLVQYGLMIFFGVRLAPANATSIARKKFAFFDAWKVTRGRFWPLLGAFAIWFLIYLGAVLVLYIIMFATVLATALPTLTQLGSSPEQLAGAEAQILQAYVQALSSPQTWVVMGVLYLLVTIVGVMFYVACFGINARAAQAALEEGKIAPAA